MLNLVAAIALSLGVLAVSVYVGVYLAGYKTSVTEMLGMMVGMTQGMMTGIAVGYLASAASDMFIGNLIGVAVGVTFGVLFGRVGGLMGMMDGGMGGLMGGMMGAMLGVMLQYLYDGWAVYITTPLMVVLYLVAMLALVRLVRHAASAQLEKDPVCEMKVDPKTALQYTHQGHTYYFCAPACRRSFIKTREASPGSSDGLKLAEKLPSALTES
jgi:YHS domain-containing protein